MKPEYLLALINENLKPENIKYRYDFFYDDCSTRIRDLLEKSIGEKLNISTCGNRKNPDFQGNGWQISEVLIPGLNLELI